MCIRDSSNAAKPNFRMPPNYNFSTRNFNWKEYESDFLLRTDAVWEKYKLKDIFRSYLKVFYFDKGLKNYQIIEPDDIYQLLYENTSIDDFTKFPGYTPTGRTNSFQATIGPKQKVNTPVQTLFIRADYFDLCALRFEKWHRCDMAFYDIRNKFDYNMDQKNYKSYPCYRDFYEATYACQDDIFDFLMELAFAKKANDTFVEDHQNWETRLLPTVWDTPNKAEKKVLTYQAASSGSTYKERRCRKIIVLQK
eukprot:TRINITY_DN1654_c0_g1_i11.p1 TRINITY_DN1654_c0_g1~~TRINITY_DN1654_c0_g1_i11.p1  ORF type:complete len:251 (-),score=91.35 TRINITY_DN1654_c0_g1_i11:225-977(-)